MVEGSKNSAIIVFLESELNRSLSRDKYKLLLKDIEALKEIFDQEESEESLSLLNKFYSSIKNRRIVESFFTALKSYLTADEYTKFIVSFAGHLININEPMLAADLCYKIISPNYVNSKNYKYIAEAYLILSDSFMNQAYWEESNNYVRLAEIIYKSINDINGLLNCFNREGIIEAEQGNIKKASENFEQALKLLDSDDTENEQQKIKLNLGIIYTILDETKRAEKYLKTSAEYFTKNKDKQNSAMAYHNLGMYYFRNRQFDDSQKNYNKSLAISTKYNLLMPKCFTFISKAELALSKNSIAAAGRFALKGFNLAIQTNDQISQAEYYRINGLIHTIKKNYQLAEKNFKISLRINKEINSKLNYSETAIELSKLYLLLNDFNNAEKYAALAKSFYKKNNIKRELEIIKKIENNLSTFS